MNNENKPLIWLKEIWYDLARFTSFWSLILIAVCVAGILCSSLLSLEERAISALELVSIWLGGFVTSAKGINTFSRKFLDTSRGGGTK